MPALSHFHLAGCPLRCRTVCGTYSCLCDANVQTSSCPKSCSLAEIDSLVGERGRSAFLAEIVQREIQRRKLLAAVREARGSWKTVEHPELEDGSEACVQRLRTENEIRLTNLPDA